MKRADEREFHYIYKITREDGKYYIGMHSTDNLDDGYFGSGQRLWHSIRKHGKKKHTKVIMEFLSSRSDLRAREAELVNRETLRDEMCLNLTLGGNSNLHTAESRMKISNGCRERWTDEARMKFSKAIKGKPKSLEMRSRLSNSKKGIARSEETKQKMRDAQIGKKKPHSPEHKAKRLAGIQAYWTARRAAKPPSPL